MRALLVGALLALLCLPVPAAAQSPSHLRPDGHVNLVWLYGGDEDEYRQQVASMVGVTVVSPTWWYLDRDDPGGIDDSGDLAFTQWAQARGLAVWPLLGNRIDPDLTDAVLRDPARRARLVAETVASVQRIGADGVNVDFENMHDQTAPLLTTLVAELKAALPDKVISVDVTVMTDTWVLDNWSTAFDRPGLAAVADYVMLMAYDQHNTLRPDGPVAGHDWVVEAVEFLLRTTPPDKVVLSVPLYARDWVDAGDHVDLDATLGIAAMQRRVAERGAVATFDEAAGVNRWDYVDAEGRAHRVWLDDPASLGRKADLVGRYGLAGTAAWRGGFEPPEAWLALDAALNAAGRTTSPQPAPAAAPLREGDPQAGVAPDSGVSAPADVVAQLTTANAPSVVWPLVGLVLVGLVASGHAWRVRRLSRVPGR